MEKTTARTAARLAELWIYPVKGFAGIDLEEAGLTSEGLAWDRRWMMIDAEGRFMTQRRLPAMAAIRVQLTEHELCLLAPCGRQLHLPLTPPQGPLVKTKVHGDACFGIDEGEEVSAWLERVFEGQWKTPLRLLRFARDTRAEEALLRRVGEQRFEQMGRSEVISHTGFADGYPLLIASRASLDALNQALLERGAQMVEMTRFRPNLVIEGLPAFAEHRVEEFARLGGKIRLWACKPCERCPVVKVDQISGEIGDRAEPLATLMTLSPFDGSGGRAYFGVNAVVLSGSGGKLRVGDRLRAR